MSVTIIAEMPMLSAVPEWRVVFTKGRCIVLAGLFVLVVFSVSCSRDDVQPGADTGPVQTRRLEYDRDKDGQTDMRVDTVTRDRKDLYVRIERRLENDRWASTRSYSVSGKLVAVEEDKDADGFYETLIVFDSSRKDLEVFSRKQDRSTVVASAEVKASYRKMFQAVDDFWDNAPSAADDKTAEKLISETKEKIDSAGVEIQSLQKPK
jgi:hypothetical protein